MLTLPPDLSSLFDWNTKQLFVLVTAHYRTRNNVRVTVVDVLPVTHPLPQPRNQVVLWDRIIRRGDSAILDLRSAATKYNFFDDGRGLKSVHTTLSLCISLNSRYICHLQGKPEYDFAGDVECGSNCWSSPTNLVFTILPPIPQLLLDTHHNSCIS